MDQNGNTVTYDLSGYDVVRIHIFPRDREEYLEERKENLKKSRERS